MRLGVYVGSFNPVHKGHIKIINYLLNNVLDKVLVIPTGNYWDKNNLIDIDNRIDMLKMYESDKVIIDNKYNDIKYTYEIMRKLKDEYKDDTLYLVVGADNIVEFDKWMEYRELLTYNLIIINRGDIDIKKYLLDLNKKDGYLIIDDLDIDISSTYVRECFKNKDYKDIDKYIDKKVFLYLMDNKLYMEDVV